MRKRIIIAVLLLGVGFCGFSQQIDTQRRAGAIIPGLKIQYITRQLKLTSEESAFWPLYYDYLAELKRSRMEQTDDIIANEEKILEIKKKYRPEFKKILVSDDRVLKVFMIERDFNAILRAELQKRALQRNNE